MNRAYLAAAYSTVSRGFTAYVVPVVGYECYFPLLSDTSSWGTSSSPVCDRDSNASMTNGCLPWDMAYQSWILAAYI